MHAITIREPGDPDVLEWTQVSDPEPAKGEVLLDVAASAVNRADVMQRLGKYPPPAGASEILGLECSGTIAALGDGVTGWQIGDEVCALLAGGGYAQRAAVPAEQLLPLPDGVDLVTAAGLPEVACTVWSMVEQTAKLGEGEVFLVHGGAGGIGTHAIQVAKALGARVATTAGSNDRLERCRDLGADILVNYREQDFVDEVRKATGDHGADVVLDNMGAKYLDANLNVLATSGRLIIIGMQGGIKGELNVAKVLGKRAHLHAAGLRGRPVHGWDGKAAIVADVRDRVWPMIAAGTVKPVVHEVVPMERAADAHRALDEGGVFGKLVLRTP